MHTIAILSQKGGAGKTTLAVNLAVAADHAGKATAIIDLDPQASACTWADNRDAQTPTVDSIQPARLTKAIDTLRDAGADCVFIDTPPSTEQAAMYATEVADLVLVPCRPGFLDLVAINQTLVHVSSRGKLAVLVLNAVPSSASIAEEAKTAASTYDAVVAPVQVHQRVAFMHAMRDGYGVVEAEPKGKAADEIKKLYRFVMKELKHGRT